MNVLLITIGSHGDVHPFVGIGAEMRRRGHEVTLITSGYFETLVRRENLNFIPLSTAEEFADLISNKDLWHPTRAFKVLASGVGDHLARVYEPIVAHLQSRPDTLVIASSLALAARIAYDKIGFPFVTAHLSPAIFRSAEAPPRLAGAFMPSWMPKKIVRSMWEFADRFVLDPLLAPPVNRFRAKLNLPPARGIMRDFWHSPQCTIGLFPDWFAPKQIDWPPQTVLTGFPLYDERGHAPLPTALVTFLAVGDAPILFTPGSAMKFGDRFFEAAVDACVKINRRGVLLSRHRKHIPRELPASVIHVDYAPFSELLPRAAALVHHGGIGTTSQALRAGIPQLVMPMAHDQLDNAKRVRKLNAGDEIARRFFRPSTLARKLDELLTNPRFSTGCAAVRKKFESVDAIEQTCDIAEQVFEKYPKTGEGTMKSSA